MDAPLAQWNNSVHLNQSNGIASTCLSLAANNSRSSQHYMHPVNDMQKDEKNHRETSVADIEIPPDFIEKQPPIEDELSFLSTRDMVSAAE